MTITIDGTPVQAILSSISITKDLNGRSSQCSFDLALDPLAPSTFPTTEQEVIITNSITGTKIFRGFITSLTIDQKSIKLAVWTIGCIGLEFLLQNVSINRAWVGMTDRAIIQDAFTSVLPEVTTTSATVSQLLTSIDYTAKDQTLVEFVKQIAALSGADWFISCDKALVYYPSGSIVAPFAFGDHPNIG